MSEKRTIILRGTPEVDEQDAAVATIRPGYLVKRPAAGLDVQSVSNARVPVVVALERDELGTGIDNTYQGATTPTAFYASGDRVKVASLYPGCRATMWIASGQNIQKDEALSSAGDGTLKAEATFANAVAISREEVGAVTVATAIEVEIV